MVEVAQKAFYDPEKKELLEAYHDLQAKGPCPIEKYFAIVDYKATKSGLETVSKALSEKAELSKKRWGEIAAYQGFAERNGITSPSQLLKLNPPYLQQLNRREKILARMIIRQANRQLSTRHDWPDLRLGRRVAIELTPIDSLFYEVQALSEKLQKLGAIFSARIMRGYGGLLFIYC